MLILSLLLVISNIPTPVQAEPSKPCDDVSITEIGANFPDNEQFIELFNCSSIDKDLNGYWVETAYGAGTTKYKFTIQQIIPSGTYFALYLSSAEGLKLTKSPTSLRRVQLLKQDSATSAPLVVDSVSYGKQSSNKSWSLIDGIWQSATATPGRANGATVNPDPNEDNKGPDDESSDDSSPSDEANRACASLKITEIGAYPGGDGYDRQFIELINNSDQPINIKGCRIMTNRSTTKYSTFADEALKSGDIKLVFIDETDGLLLSKTVAGIVYVVSSDGKVELDVQAYPAPKSGTSWWLLDDTWQISKQPSPGLPNALPPVNYCDGVKLSEIGANLDEQFIEITNSNNQPVNLSGCQLMTNRSATKFFAFGEGMLDPGNFLVIKISATLLNLTKTTTGVVYLYSSDGELEIDSTTYADISKDASWSMINGEWLQTYAVTPGSPNVFQEYPACQNGYYRNLETGRCNKIIVAAAPASCAAGYYRNESTNRCRKITTASTLTPCKEGQERNPETNRCRKIANTATALKPCADGYERNSETNRCRKIVSTAAAQFAVESGPSSNTSGHMLLAAIGVLAATIGILLFQYRMEIGQFAREVKARFSTTR